MYAHQEQWQWLCQKKSMDRLTSTGGCCCNGTSAGQTDANKTRGKCSERTRCHCSWAEQCTCSHLLFPRSFQFWIVQSTWRIVCPCAYTVAPQIRSIVCHVSTQEDGSAALATPKACAKRVASCARVNRQPSSVVPVLVYRAVYTVAVFALVVV